MTATPNDARPLALARQGRPIAAMASSAAAIELLGQTLALSDQPTRAVIFGGLSLAAWAAALLCLVGGSQGAGVGLIRWRLGSWTLVWYAVAFGIATVSWSRPQTGLPAQIAVSDVLRALWLVAVGMTIWAIGYLVGPGQWMRGCAVRTVGALDRRFAPEVRSRAPWILYAIGIAARLASTATTGRFGYSGDVSSVVTTASGYGQILTGLSLCAPLAVAAAALQVYRERLASARITLIVLFLSELAFGAAAGGKESFVITVLAVAIPFCTSRRRLPRVALMILAVIFLIAVIPFNKAYRSAVRSGSGTLSPSEAISAAPEIFHQTVINQNVATVVPDSFGYLLQRIREIDSPAIIMQRTPGQVAFLSPIQLVEAPAEGIVPRAIWPGKPIMVMGYQVSQEYYGLPSTVLTSSAITPIGDLYWHGGWVPVIAGMFVLGCVVRLLDEVFDVRSNPHAIAFVLLLFPALVMNEVDWVTLLSGIPSTVVIWLLAVALTFRTRSST